MASKGIVVDFTGVEAFVKMPVGIHNVVVKEAEIGSAKSSDNRVLTIVFEHESGATVKHRLTLTKNALWKLKQFLEAIGEKGLDGKFKLEPDKLIGKKCSVEIGEEEYDGKMYARVENCMKATASTKTTASKTADVEEEEEDDDFEELL